MTRNATRQTQSLHQFLLRLAALVCLDSLRNSRSGGLTHRIDLIVFRHLHPQTNETFLQQSGPREPNRKPSCSAGVLTSNSQPTRLGS